MLPIIRKNGGLQKTFQILKELGWKRELPAFYIMNQRGSISRDAALLLMDYCHRHGIEVSPSDFQEEK